MLWLDAERRTGEGLPSAEPLPEPLTESNGKKKAPVPPSTQNAHGRRPGGQLSINARLR
ncbi:hypothetical protein ACFFX0_10860 [Citricoccus parietis]|uniref:Transposase n=1 Tax=Citricoccus parietis TaxID=592307 RepID=A0ABV5FZ31_9MICC